MNLQENIQRIKEVMNLKDESQEEKEGVGAYAAPAFEMKPDHVHFKHIYNEDELEEKESGEKWIKCVNCKKKFTQTIHKGKKSLPICPNCGTHNDIMSESMPNSLKRRMGDLDNFIRSTYDWLNPRAFGSFDEFISRVIFTTTREISTSLFDVGYEETLKIREEIEPFIANYIVDNFSNEIEEHYLKGIK
jgi:DNA-directed RNA polymerase subunit RPC12/RpoP